MSKVSIQQLSHHLNQQLLSVSSEEKSIAGQRYFPDGVVLIGATAGDIQQIIKTFHTQHLLSAEQTLELSEQLLKTATYIEQKLMAFGLLNKYVGKHFDDTLLSKFEFWLEHYADNWSLVDDLCIKTIYKFLLKRPELIEQTQHWANSSISWCRRASCVVWVKFIERKMGKTVYRLNPDLVFRNCQKLLADEDPFVQKGIGWLLKVTAVHHSDKVLAFLSANYQQMPRSTIRYAIEKLDKPTREHVLSWR